MTWPFYRKQSLNRVELIGRLGEDPAAVYLPSGLMYCYFQLVTEDDPWHSAEGDALEVFQWHPVGAYGEIGEYCASYLGLGTLIYLEGRLSPSTRYWHEEYREKHLPTEIVAQRVIILSDPGEWPPEQTEPLQIPDVNLGQEEVCPVCGTKPSDGDPEAR